MDRENSKMIKPTMLKKGDSVAIVSLSSGILGEKSAHHQLKLGIKRLRQMGLKPICMPNALSGLKELHDNPEKRAADLKTAFANPKIKGIICVIGGDDTYRLLPYLLEDANFIESVKRNPKIFTGFSDTTINHLMLYRLGLATFYGPNLLSDLAELDKAMLPYTRTAFTQYFHNPTTTQIQSSPIWYEERTDFSLNTIGTPRISHIEKDGYQILRGKGHLTGKLLGGCLDSLYDCLTQNRYVDEATVIKKYQIFPTNEEWKNKVLFIETSEEKPNPDLYEQMLLTLKKQGVLENVAGIIVGKPQNNAFFEEYKAKLLAVTADLKTPIMYNVNFGHAFPRTVIPYGAMVDIDLDQSKIKITEPFFDTEMKSM